jgi:hypothetical protein
LVMVVAKQGTGILNRFEVFSSDLKGAREKK